MSLSSNILEHYGIKGQRWGVRRPRGSDGLVGTSEDAKKASEVAAKVKRGGTKAASNEELRSLVNRINLERDYARATAEKTTVEKGQDRVARILSVGATANNVLAFSTSPAGKLIAESLGVKSAGGKHKKGVKKAKKK